MERLAVLLPPRPFAGDLGRRTVLYWVGARGFLYVFGDRTLFDDPNHAMAVLVVVTLALLVDARARRMDLLLDDLGRGTRSMLIVPALAVVAVETIAFALTIARGEG